MSLLPLILGFLLDQLVGDPPRWPHPVRWIGWLIHTLESLLRRGRWELAAGILLLLLVTAITGGICAALLTLADWIDPLVWLLAATLCIHFGLAARSLADETETVLEACERDDWIEARQRLSRIVGRDTEDLPPEAIYRACIETVAENTTDGIVAPLLFAAIGGPVLLWMYKAISTLDSMVGYRNERYLRFGWASARTDDGANFLPARLTWVLVAFAAGLLRADAFQALRIGWRDSRKHPSPNSAWSEAAMAGALGMQLGGPSTYGGLLSSKPLLGDAGDLPSLLLARRAIRLMRVTSWLALVVALTLRAFLLELYRGWAN